MAHKLHEKIGNALMSRLKEPFEVVLDYACESETSKRQQIPLFMDEPKCRKNQICKVDAIVLKGDQVHTVIEIEESSILPTKVCGKVLTAAFAKFYEGKDSKSYYLRNSQFIQILSGKSLKDRTKKREQEEIIQQKINGMLQHFSTIKEYRLFWVSEKDEFFDKIVKAIKDYNLIP